jgi:hypothetical protein
MPNILLGRFYEFHVERVISRAGQPIQTMIGIEVGPEISRELAFKQVREGMDVYTLGKNDAYQLELNVLSGRPVEHNPSKPAYFPHYHPGGATHKYDRSRPGRLRATVGPGHVFFGERGQGI